MKEIVGIAFSGHPFLWLRINLPNQDFNQFSCSKQQMQAKRYLKACLCNEFEKNRRSRFWYTYLWSNFRLFILLPIFTKNRKTFYPSIWQYIYIKFGCSDFIRFGDILIRRFHLYTCTYAQTNFQKTLFWIERTLKHINKVKIRHQIFWPNTIFPLPALNQ